MSVRRPPRGGRRPQILVVANPNSSGSDSDDGAGKTATTSAASTARPAAATNGNYRAHGPPPPRTPVPYSAGLPPQYTPSTPLAAAAFARPSSRTNDTSSSSTSRSSSSPAPEPATPLIAHDVPGPELPPPIAHVKPADVYPQTARPDPGHAHSPTHGRLVIMAAVGQQFVFVDITGARSSDFIRERVFSKLQIPDDDQHKYLIFRTEAGEYPNGPPLDNHDLLATCLRHADKSGSLKFLVLPSATHRQPLHVDTQDLSATKPGGSFSPLRDTAVAPARTRYPHGHESESEHSRPTSPSPSTGTATHNAHLYLNSNSVPRITTPTPGPPSQSQSQGNYQHHQLQDGSWRPQLPQQPHSFPGQTSNSNPRAPLRTYSGKALPPPPTGPPPAIPANQQPFSHPHPHAFPRGPLSASAGPSTAGPLRLQTPTSGNSGPSAGVGGATPNTPHGPPHALGVHPASYVRTPPAGARSRAVDPRWFNASTPASGAGRLPLGASPVLPPPQPPFAQFPGSGQHTLANAKSISDLRSAAQHAPRKRQNSVGEGTPTSPYSPAGSQLTAGGPLSASGSVRPVWSDTEGGSNATQIRRPSRTPAPAQTPSSPRLGRRIPSPTAQGLGPRPPQVALAVPVSGDSLRSTVPPSPNGPRSADGEATLMPPFRHQPQRLAPQAVPLPPTPQPEAWQHQQYSYPTSLNTPAHLMVNDDDNFDDEETLWAKKPSVTPQPTASTPTLSSTNKNSPPTYFPRPESPPQHNRPKIQVSINDVPTQLSPFSATTAGGLPSAGGSGSSGSPSGGGRRRPPSEFYQREGVTWNVRPPPEEVYDHLQRFFPGVDLDKPMIETSGASSPIESPNDAAAPSQQSAAAAQQAEAEEQAAREKARKARMRKSIRIVANERRKILRESRIVQEKLPGAPVPVLQPTPRANKRSTQLWDIKVEEVMPSALASAESPTGVSGGRAVTKWVKGGLIGKGTFGRVYLALNVNTGEMIAVKQVELPKTDSDRNDTRQTAVVDAIKSESATLRDLMHPHVVEYLGFEETSDFFNLFLEYVPGGSIGGVLRKLGKFSEEVCQNFTAQILEGLEYLHTRQILHRDLKGDNILVDTLGICKITDFGISKRTDDIYSLDASATNMQGSIPWMAPEVLSNNGMGYSAKIDIWSVGCIYAEMMTGHRPWRDEAVLSVMYKVGAGRARPPIPDLSPIATDFTTLCMASDPKDRPTAAVLRHHPYLDMPDGWTFTSFQT